MIQPQHLNFSEPATTLFQHNALLVHCAGQTQMVAAIKRVEDPVERLRCAINLRCNVACSTLVLGDAYRAYGETNMTGPIGLILDPVKIENITMCCHVDAGTYADKENPKMRIGVCRDRITQERFSNLTLGDAISQRPRNEYNEICAHSYKVLGLLVAEDPAIFGGNDVTEPVYDDEGNLTEIRLLPASGYRYTCANLREKFPELPIYRWFSDRGIRRFDGINEQGIPILSELVSIASIYGS